MMGRFFILKGFPLTLLDMIRARDLARVGMVITTIPRNTFLRCIRRLAVKQFDVPSVVPAQTALRSAHAGEGR